MFRVLFDGFDLTCKVFNTFEEAEAYRLANLNSCEYACWVDELNPQE